MYLKLVKKNQKTTTCKLVGLGITRISTDCAQKSSPDTGLINVINQFPNGASRTPWASRSMCRLGPGGTNGGSPLGTWRWSPCRMGGSSGMAPDAHPAEVAPSPWCRGVGCVPGSRATPAQISKEIFKNKFHSKLCTCELRSIVITRFHKVHIHKAYSYVILTMIKTPYDSLQLMYDGLLMIYGLWWWIVMEVGHEKQESNGFIWSSSLQQEQIRWGNMIIDERSITTQSFPISVCYCSELRSAIMSH